MYKTLNLTKHGLFGFEPQAKFSKKSPKQLESEECQTLFTDVNSGKSVKFQDLKDTIKLKNIRIGVNERGYSSPHLVGFIDGSEMSLIINYEEAKVAFKHTLAGRDDLDVYCNGIHLARIEYSHKDFEKSVFTPKKCTKHGLKETKSSFFDKIRKCDAIKKSYSLISLITDYYEIERKTVKSKAELDENEEEEAVLQEGEELLALIVANKSIESEKFKLDHSFIEMFHEKQNLKCLMEEDAFRIESKCRQIDNSIQEIPENLSLMHQIRKILVKHGYEHAFKGFKCFCN